MAFAITVPRLGWTMEEGTFVGWLKVDGQEVRPGDLLFVLESEKATEEVQAVDGGILHISSEAPSPGGTVAVGATIGYLLGPGEEPPARPAPARATANEGAGGRGHGSGGGSRRAAAAAAVARSARELERRRGATNPVSPRAARLARELGVELARVSPSGRSGRIRARDVLAVAHAAASVVSAGAGGGRPVEPLDPASAARRAIAERMLASSRNTAAVTLTTTADATEIVHLAKDFARREGAAAPGLTDFLVAVTAAALLDHPGMNAHWINGRPVPAGDVNIGLAVDTPRALLVPVIHGAASLDIHDLSARCRELVERARDGDLEAAEMRGGTFTITNLGMLDIDTFTPIIREPEIGILGIGRLRRQPVVHDGEIIARDVISLSLTFDHRAIDGAPAARFLRAIRRLIEDPGPRFQE